MSTFTYPLGDRGDEYKAGDCLGDHSSRLCLLTLEDAPWGVYLYEVGEEREGRTSSPHYHHHLSTSAGPSDEQKDVQSLGGLHYFLALLSSLSRVISCGGDP